MTVLAGLLGEASVPARTGAQRKLMIEAYVELVGPWARDQPSVSASHV